MSARQEGASGNQRRAPLLPPALPHTDHQPPASISTRKYVSADQTPEAVVVCYGSPGRRLSRYEIAVGRVHCVLLPSGLISTPAFDDCSLPRGLANSGAASPPFWCPWHPSLVPGGSTRQLRSLSVQDAAASAPLWLGRAGSRARH